jgi:predicted dehydrogenase
MSSQRTKELNVAIIGAGRMGSIRATSIANDHASRLIQVVDNCEERAQALASTFACAFSTNWEDLLVREDIDTFVVSATHNLLSTISTAALRAGKNVFCEKPMARTVPEAQAVVDATRESGQRRPPVFRLGCTLRHHPAIRQARMEVHNGTIGQPLYIRAHYGHGGRPLYDQEWRMVPELGGGGELLDQGIHLIDLSRWFLGDLSEISGMVSTYYWTGSAHLDPPIKERFNCAPGVTVDDNAFLLLRNRIGQTASLHASWTQWKNSFSFEIFGHDGSLVIDGLGGSYGEEKLIHARRRAEGGIPETTVLLTASTDGVWDREWNAFSRAVTGADEETGAEATGESATAEDGLEAIRIVRSVYDAARSATRG